MGLGLLPFFLACAVYLLVQSSADQPSGVSALLKSLPVLYLAGFLGTAHPGGGYRSLLQGALLCSAVGDAFLVWPEAFLHGESGWRDMLPCPVWTPPAPAGRGWDAGGGGVTPQQNALGSPGP